MHALRLSNSSKREAGHMPGQDTRLQEVNATWGGEA